VVNNKEIIKVRRRLAILRKKLEGGDNVSTDQINKINNKFKSYRKLLRPNEKDELLTIVNQEGRFTNLKAPRWLCHLLDLRHMCVHVLLTWYNKSLISFFVLQVRSWNKADFPGCVDISVGGHVVGPINTDPIDSAYREMEEEMGISRQYLANGRLIHVGAYQSSERNSEINFYNTEWREIYTGEIKQDGLNAINFKDKEVAGLYLCPEYNAKHLVNQMILPIASGLQFSLPQYFNNKPACFNNFQG